MPKWRELKRFCERDGWNLYRSTDHDYYEKVQDDGVVLRTRVSRGSGEISKALWKEIRDKQLCTTQDYFNSLI